MGLPAERHAMKLDEFLAWEAEQPERWEFVDGEAFAMAGGSDVHNTIAGNTYIALRTALRGTRCNVFMTDVRLRLAEDDSLFYSDVFVSCSEADRARRQVKEDPALIVEVLSPTTEAYDRGRKFEAYRHFPGLRTVLFVRQDRPQVECYTRQDDGGWLLSEASSNAGSIALPALGFDLALAELYRDLPDDADADTPPHTPTPPDPSPPQ